jgi:dipeptidyl aminopeptidase/acylaminoacyl peptidase
MNRYMLLVATVFSLSVGAYGQTKKTIQPADILDLRTVSDAQISPDGRKIIFVVTMPETPAAKRSSQIWVVDTDGEATQRPLIFSGSSDTSPRWAPDGMSVAFLTTRPNPLSHDSISGYKFSTPGTELPKSTPAGQEKKESPEGDSPADAQIWLLHLSGGEAEPLTDIPGGVKSFQWLADGRSIAFLRRDPESNEDKERKRKKQDWNVALENHVFDRLWLYDLAKKEARLITRQNFNVDAFTPSPDGSQFLLTTSPTPFLNDFYYLNKTIVVDSATGEEKKTITGNGRFSGQWSRDGKHLVIQERSGKGIASYPFIYDFETDTKIPITSPVPSTVEGVDWGRNGKVLTAFSEENTHVILQHVNVRTGEASTSQVLGAVNGNFTASKDGMSFAFICSTPNHPGEVCIDTGEARRILTEFNPQVSTWKLGKSEEIKWKSTRDGLVIHGLLVYPADYEQGKRYKTVVQIHGGPIEGWVNGWNASWYNPAQLYASHGYAVFLPMVRGSSGSGPGFEELNDRDWGTGDFPDLMDGVDAVIALGVADPDRLVMGGWSYGGYMTAWGITQTHRFKAAMIGAGISDVFTDALTTDIAPTYLDGYFGPAMKNRRLYDEHSAISFLDQVTTPVLLLHGEADLRVPTSQSLELYDALRFLGKDVVMVTYPREPHIFTEREHQIDSLTRMLNWYDGHVQ